MTRIKTEKSKAPADPSSNKKKLPASESRADDTEAKKSLPTPSREWVRNPGKPASTSDEQPKERFPKRRADSPTSEARGDDETGLPQAKSKKQSAAEADLPDSSKSIKKEKKKPKTKPLAEIAPTSETRADKSKQGPQSTRETTSIVVDESVSETPSGKICWRVQVKGPKGTRSPGASCPAVDQDGNVYLCLGNRLFAFHPDSQTGLKKAWSRQAGGVIPASPVVGPDGHVRVHSDDGMLHGFTSRGAAVWKEVFIGEPLRLSCPLVDAENNTWISSSAGGLARVNAEGELDNRLYFRGVAKLDSAGFLQEGAIYIGAEDQFIYAIDVTGKRGHNRWDQNHNRGRLGGCVDSSLGLLGNHGVVATAKDRLYALDWDGKELWTTRLPGTGLTSPIVSEDHCFVGMTAPGDSSSPKGKLWCLDCQSGHRIWEYVVEHPIVTPPLVGADRVLYFGDDHGTVYAVNVKGVSEWKTALPAPLQSAGTLMAPGQLVFVLADNSIVGIRCSSERLASGWPKFRGTLDQSGRTS